MCRMTQLVKSQRKNATMIESRVKKLAVPCIALVLFTSAVVVFLFHRAAPILAMTYQHWLASNSTTVQ